MILLFKPSKVIAIELFVLIYTKKGKTLAVNRVFSKFRLPVSRVCWER